MKFFLVKVLGQWILARGRERETANIIAVCPEFHQAWHMVWGFAPGRWRATVRETILERQKRFLSESGE